MEDILKARQLKEELDALRPIDKIQEDRIMQKFRLDWNYHSNNLEGNSLTYGETKALLLHGVTAQGKPLKDHFEVTGHNEAINWVLDMVKGDRPLTENFIRELHTLLLKEPYEVDAITPDGKPTKKKINVGSYKSSPNHVETKTGEIFYFATPEDTPAKMSDLMQWYNDKIAQDEVTSILLAAEFHYRFILIHPFDDGNGRTARILMNFILMKFGYPPVIVKTEDKENYYRVLRLADTGNLQAFVDYIAQNLVHSLEIMIAGAKGESIEEPDDIDKQIALLEKRLAGYGDQIEKEKSLETINDIYQNTILKLAERLQLKLQPFEKHYLEKNIFFIIDDVSYSYYLNQCPLFFTEQKREIRLHVSYRSINKQKLHGFSFFSDIVFDFKQYNYSVHLHDNREFYTKFYENLNDSEIDEIIKFVINQHNKSLEETLSRKN
ncbi:hypothetical protein GCM10007424_25340 [Flavobacterium suaedae]|uniref:Fido domain-containing protein n=2 Tax=Flavobacterium suaedae TaxID=1767027 RepID=A0ABQ1K2M1_9FLAO|nr:hypothetical protein GCM10007424_25340 [Flavobacterium suaedae]